MRKDKKGIEKKLWRNISKYIRLRDCLKTTGTIIQGECVTCKKIYPFEELQAGHFIHGHADSIHYNLNNIHAQCIRCNKHLSGNMLEYYPYMLEKYGQEYIESLKFKKNNSEKKTIEELEQLNITMKKLIKELTK